MERWKAQGTSILSDGADRRSNLNKSIAMSLSSPRFTSTPEAEALLSLLAMLPDGISLPTFNQVTTSVPNMLKCMTTLRRTSLVSFLEHGEHVNTLVPIREYTRKHFAPPTVLLEKMRDYFYDLLDIYFDVEQPPPGGSCPIISNLGNIRSILQYFMLQPGPHVKRVVRAIIQLSNFTYFSGYGTFDLLRSTGDLDKGSGDEKLYGEYLATLAKSQDEGVDVEALMLESIQRFEAIGDLSAQAKSHTYLSQHFMRCGEMVKSKAHGDTALRLGIEARDVRAEASAMLKISAVEYRLGTVTLALKHAHEARNLSRQGSDVLHEIMSTRQEVHYLVARGDYGKAATACAEAVVLLHALGLDSSSFLYRVIIILQGEVHLCRTEYDEMRKVNEPLATFANKLQGEALGVRGYALHNLALADILTGAKDVPGILANLGAARRIFIDLGDNYGLDLCNMARMELHVISREYEPAKAICQETVAPAGKSGDILTVCFERLGDIAFADDDFTAAFRYYVVLFAAAQKHEDMRGTTMALRRIGDIFKIDGDVGAALHSWKIALDVFTGMEVHRGRAECMFRIGDVYRERGDAARAKDMLQSARGLFERCSQTEQIRNCEERILGL